MPNSATILIIDDDPNLLWGLHALFSGAGYTVLTARNGKDGLEQIHQKKPDLAICDVRMSPPDGFELLRLLNSEPETQSLPVIYLTACKRPEDEIAAIRNGAADYITKPFNPDLLLARVQSVLRWAGIRSQAGASAPQAQPGGFQMPKTNPTSGYPAPNYENGTPINQVAAPQQARFGSPAYPANSLLDSLSDREKEVFKLIAEGKTNAEIAAKFLISEATVRSHISHIRSKLKLENRVQLTVYAVVGATFGS